MMCRAYGALLFLLPDPALTRWANFAARLRRWLHTAMWSHASPDDATFTNTG
jgi:hypothetical protein